MKLRTAAVSVAALAAVGATALPAQADSGNARPAAEETVVQPLAGQDIRMIYKVGGHEVGRGAFYSQGDRIWVKDSRADGRGVRVQYDLNYNPGAPDGQCSAPGGSGTSKFCDYNFRENGKIRIRIVAGSHTSAWSPWANIG
ncbi:hypothetical protein ACH4E8_05465 [Streptomyces sp. NPDC017979]|uniref:hypothetical protein n=1 Tax=unclassified Streptomyces TaxID=2593676 RepID=UPI00378EF973